MDISSKVSLLFFIRDRTVFFLNKASDPSTFEIGFIFLFSVGKHGLTTCKSDDQCPEFSSCNEEYKCICKSDLVGNGGTCDLGR